MDAIEQNLASWQASLVSAIPLGGLQARNSTVYKWKAPFRSWILREAVFWRLQDLCAQSYALHQQGHGLGARILLRSAFETLAMLIYLNQITQQLLDGKLPFSDFSQKTITLLLGSKDKSTSHTSLNIMTVLEKCNKRYPGLAELYGMMSESAHPNYEGLLLGYSKSDRNEGETKFSNRNMENYGPRHPFLMETCMGTFDFEYNTVWTDLIEKLETWIEENDTALEASKAEKF